MVDAAAFLSSINAAERETICKFKEEKACKRAFYGYYYNTTTCMHHDAGNVSFNPSL